MRHFAEDGENRVMRKLAQKISAFMTDIEESDTQYMTVGYGDAPQAGSWDDKTMTLIIDADFIAEHHSTYREIFTMGHEVGHAYSTFRWGGFNTETWSYDSENTTRTALGFCPVGNLNGQRAPVTRRPCP